MGEKIAFENGRISDFWGLVTLTLDQVILHTVVHHSSTSIYIPNLIEIEETFRGRTDGRRTFETGFIRSTDLMNAPTRVDKYLQSQFKNSNKKLHLLTSKTNQLM